MSEAPERIWARTTSVACGSWDDYRMVESRLWSHYSSEGSVEYVRADCIEQLAAINEELIAERDEAWKRAGHAEKMWGEAEVKLSESEALLAKAVEAGIDVAASLNAAISLLERGGKKAAPSDKMFAQMLVDYSASLDRFRTTIAELTGGKDE